MKIDYEYEISEEQIRAYLEIPELERLRWLEELCVFTNMFRQAPEVPKSEPATLAPRKPAAGCA
ncbi:MAG TPA: hypothetical protein VGQ54_09710 [Burkholderiales bacterium]|jgi:hypothetical protein|nr:hypothetical protein [Burkholderiales bacterium]